MGCELSGIGIIGTGSALPEKAVTNKDIEKMVETSDEWIVARTGIRERRVAGDDISTSDLAVRAGKRVLETTGMNPLDIGAIVVGTCTPDHIFPNTACLVQAALGADNASALDVIYATVVGASLMKAGIGPYVLVIGADTLSKVLDWTDRGTCILFGDGAGAVLLGPVGDGRGIQSYSMSAIGAKNKELIVPAGGSRKPASPETLAAREHYIQMNGNEVFRFATRVAPKVAEKNIQDAGLTKDDIDFFLLHQANFRILDSARKRLKVPKEKLLHNLEWYGNTSSASVPLLLDESVRNGTIQQGHVLSMIGFGAGLTYGGMIVRL